MLGHIHRQTKEDGPYNKLYKKLFAFLLILDVFSRKLLRGGISGCQSVTRRTSVRDDRQEVAPCENLRPERVSSQQLTYPCEMVKTFNFFFSF